MALRAVPDHPKFAALKMRLGLSKFEVLGLLEAIWHFTGRFTPQGNIGKYTDEQIESWIEWKGTPGAAIEALVDTGWIACVPGPRLEAVDWRRYWELTPQQIRRINLASHGGELSRERRLAILARDGFRCKLCGSKEDLTVDHIIPVVHGGGNTEENLQSLCRPCNGRKGGRLEWGTRTHA